MEVRNLVDLKLEEITEEFLLTECLEMGQKLGVDIRQGSIYRDASDGHIIRTSKFFNDLRQINKILSIYTCTGEVLEERLKERGMARNPEKDTKAKYYVEFEGAEPSIGARMSCEGHYFTLEKLDDRFVIVSEEAGTKMNQLVAGSPVIPDRDVDKLIRATLQELAIPAIDQESDESARKRLLDKIAGPAENGNKTQVKAWCESVEGVGRARVIPLWNGPNTVKGILIGTDGGVANKTIVEAVQNYIDPEASGMGEGVATIGAHFTATAAEAVVINISVSIFQKIGNLKELVIESIKKYIHDLALSSSERVTVRYTRIGALISQIDQIVDYDDLKINGGTENIECTIEQIPVLGEVTINEHLS